MNIVQDARVDSLTIPRELDTCPSFVYDAELIEYCEKHSHTKFLEDMTRIRESRVILIQGQRTLFEEIVRTHVDLAKDVSPFLNYDFGAKGRVLPEENLIAAWESTIPVNVAIQGCTQTLLLNAHSHDVTGHLFKNEQLKYYFTR